MNTYTLKVSLMGFKGISRWIEASGDCTFEDLHDQLFAAFDRYDEHLYQFFFPREKTTRVRKIYDSPLVIEHPMMLEDAFSFFGPSPSSHKSTEKMRLNDAKLHEKEEFYYLFDMGDEWWHKIRVEKISQGAKTKGRSARIKVVKVLGESPPQYPDYEEEESA